jgi:YesN/AraC family two-component response regulator
MSSFASEGKEEEEGGAEAPEFDRMIDNVVSEIRDHYMEDISLTSLAAKYNLSMARLSEMIKEHLKVNFSDYIASLRIQRAKELLRDESLSIQEIAEIVGYNDYFYFTKVFKKVEGISPSKYRKSI